MSNPLIVGLTGWKRSGKDTVGGMLAEHFGAKTVAYADPLKEYALALNPMVDQNDYTGEYIYLQDAVDKLGWEKTKDEFPEARKTLQRLGTEVFRNHVNPRYWTDLMDKQISETVKAGGVLIVTDCRFQNELDLVKSWHLPTLNNGSRAFTIRVNRPDVAPDPETAHESELHVAELEVDSYINNVGTLDQLRDSTGTIIRWLEAQRSR